MVGTVIAKVAGSALGATYTMPAADGAAGEFLKTDGSTNLSFGAVAASGFNQQVVYTTSSGTGGYSPGTSVTKIVVEILGAGGGGSHYNSHGPAVNSGAGGGYVRKTLTVVSTDTMTVTIGAVGGAGATNTGGGNGGDTTFASVSGTSFTTLTAGGGGGGSVVNYTPGVSGTATGGDLNVIGAPGRTQNVGSAEGGNSPYGYGGSASATSVTIPINNGTGYGSGGGGASDSGTNGTGAPGLCIITEYK
jgi:hypothetical protein